MANVSIMGLPVAVGLSGTEWAEIVQGSSSLRFQLSQLAKIMPGGYSTVPVTAGGTGLTAVAAGQALYGVGPNTLAAGTLPVTAGGTGITGIAANQTFYATGANTLAVGTLPVAAGGTGVTTKTGTGSVVLSTSPTLTTPTLTNPTLTGATLDGLWCTGVVDCVTPGAGTSGGVRIHADNASNTKNFLQFISNDGSAQWGFFSVQASTLCTWNSLFGAAAYMNTGFNPFATPGATLNIASGRRQFYQNALTANLALNITWQTSPTVVALGSILSVGQSVDFELIVTNGATPYYVTSITIDGQAATVKWLNGAPTGGDANAFDFYTFRIISTGLGVWTVFASVQKFV